MLKILLFILDKYGLQIVNLALLIFVSFKLFTNHLKHINDAIEENTKKLVKVGSEIIKLGKKVAKLEGRIGGK